MWLFYKFFNKIHLNNILALIYLSSNVVLVYMGDDYYTKNFNDKIHLLNDVLVQVSFSYNICIYTNLQVNAIVRLPHPSNRQF